MKYSKRDILNILTFDNLIDINYYYSSVKLNVLNRNIKPKILRSNVCYSILLFFILWLRKITIIKSYKKTHKLVPIMLHSFTKNQRDAINNLTAIRKDTVILGDSKFGDYMLPEFKAFFYALPFFLDVWKKYKLSKGYVRKSFENIFYDYWLTHGYLIMLMDYLKKQKIKLVIVSNDHSMRTRVPILACKSVDIKSLYLQHASVGVKFPRLTYDFALLEGQDSLDKYRAIGKIDSIVFLIGSLKMGSKTAINTNTKIDVIGLCFGLNDNLKIVENVIVELLKLFSPESIILRAHPRENRTDFLNQMKNKFDIKTSNSKGQHVLDFLTGVDAIVCGESNIHLEATFMNITSIYCVLSDDNREGYDVYGFIKNKLIQYICKTPEDLLSLVTELSIDKPEVRHLAKYYDATVGSKYDGKASLLYDQVVSFIIDRKFEFINENFNCNIVKGVTVYTLKNTV